VWHELEEEIQLEIAHLRQLLDKFAPLRKKAESVSPDTVEIVALAGLLQSFYNGIENIFKRVALCLDQTLPRGEMWHSRLLDLMAKSSLNMDPVISKVFQDRLRLYMNFRHVFRHSYSFDLQWPKMAELVSHCEIVLNLLEQELIDFLKKSTM
jgi:hypothetical protein